LANLRGELVGINTAILSPAGGNVGIGFAVPINMARSVMDQLVQTGQVRRGRIGISIRDLELTAAAGQSVGSTEGALIAEVARGSPADKAGIHKGDIVIAADGAPIRSAAQLRNKIGLTPVGRRLQLTIQRNGVAYSLSLQVAPAADDTATVPAGRRKEPALR
jgi:serine protease Do